MLHKVIDWVRDNTKVAVPAGIVLAGLVAFLAFGVFGIHTKFIDDEVSEAGPVFASGAASELPSDVVDETTTDEMNDVMDDEDIEVEVAVADSMPEMETGEVVTLSQGSFVDRSHPGTGIAKVLNDGSQERFLRFEEFATDNGPDLFVYLTRADATADAGAFGVDGDFVDLGRLKGNVGEQNYEIAPDVDLGEFDTVVVWCKRFGVAFTAADLA